VVRIVERDPAEARRLRGPLAIAWAKLRLPAGYGWWRTPREEGSFQPEAGITLGRPWRWPSPVSVPDDEAYGCVLTAARASR
jgi:hypothetical protein